MPWTAHWWFSIDPDVGEPIPSDTAGPQLRQYTDDVEHV